jgi:hypothetical protein
MWILGGVGILFLALIALVWGFSGSLDIQQEEETPSGVRVSAFDGMDDDVQIMISQNSVSERIPNQPVEAQDDLVQAPESTGEVPPSVNSVFPKESAPGEEITVRIFGNNFAPEAGLATDGPLSEIEVLSAHAVSETLIEATLNLYLEATDKEYSLTVVNPDGERSLPVSIHVISP